MKEITEIASKLIEIGVDDIEVNKLRKEVKSIFKKLNADCLTLATIQHEAIFIFQTKPDNEDDFALIHISNKSKYSTSELLLDAQLYLQERWLQKKIFALSHFPSDTAYLRRSGYVSMGSYDGIELLYKNID